MKGKWKLIPGFDGYRISVSGEVESCRYGSGGGLVFGKWRAITPSMNGRKTHWMIDLVTREGKRKSYQLHRLIYSLFVAPIPEGMHIDHRDRNGLNNDLGNLRVCDQNQNMANRVVSGGRKYKGVHPTKSGRFACQTTHQRKSVYLGRFDTEEQAAQKYNEYVTLKYGEFAVLNVLETEIN